MSPLRWFMIMLIVPEVASAAPVDFSREVLPILSDHCFACHGPDAASRKAKLRLDDRASAIERGAIVPGKSGESELLARIISTEPDSAMPPPKFNKKLSSAQVDTLKRWIDEGTNWGKHWAFEAPHRPTVPTVQHPELVREPLDAFILARLEREGLSFAPPATREQLIRRVTLDLTGIPPTPEEVDAFLNDRSPDAYDRVIDRLLASPRYGERMAWDWLDAARYADSNGYQGDQERTMWPWRDWVVQAYNDNLPFDQFTIQQLAGDLFPKARPEQILPTAFLRNHMINGEGGRIAEENRIEYVFDQAETVGTVWLGLTFNCCRCHDHKFDPISRKEYFQLFAYFNQTPVNGGGGSGQTAPIIDYPTPALERRFDIAQLNVKAAHRAVTELETELRKMGVPNPPAAFDKQPLDRNDAEVDSLIKHFEPIHRVYVRALEALRQAQRERNAAAQAIPKVMVMQDMPQPRETFMLTRGAYDKREGKVSPGVPATLPALPANAPANRLALAQWLMAAENPLTARVTVNRMWQMFFGTGLVKTTEDFGVQGERPSHPELLDWLAVEFRESGWDVKALHRRIVRSTTYQQSSKVTPALREKDPDNRLLARGPRHRLPSWMIRDQALAASGLLTLEAGGPAVKPYQPAGIWEEATFGQKSYRPDQGAALYRRSLYVFWRRIVGPTMFFDTANRQVCAVKNSTTNTPLHALVTLNEPMYVEAARTLAERCLTTPSTSDDDRLTLAFRRITGRTPTERERPLLRTALEKQRKLFTSEPEAEVRKFLRTGDSPRNEAIPLTEHAAYTAVCLMLLNLDETLNKQ